MRVVGIGVDVVEVARMERILDRHPRFAARHFSPDEIAYCDGHGRRAECYAARWAAREAFAKAMGGVPGGRWREIEVTRAEEGSVRLTLQGRARSRLEEVGGSEVHVSIAHERSLATAFCVAVGP